MMISSTAAMSPMISPPLVVRKCNNRDCIPSECPVCSDTGVVQERRMGGRLSDYSFPRGMQKVAVDGSQLRWYKSANTSGYTTVDTTGRTKYVYYGDPVTMGTVNQRKVQFHFPVDQMIRGESLFVANNKQHVTDLVTQRPYTCSGLIHPCPIPKIHDPCVLTGLKVVCGLPPDTSLQRILDTSSGYRYMREVLGMPDIAEKDVEPTSLLNWKCVRSFKLKHAVAQQSDVDESTLRYIVFHRIEMTVLSFDSGPHAWNIKLSAKPVIDDSKPSAAAAAAAAATGAPASSSSGQKCERISWSTTTSFVVGDGVPEPLEARKEPPVASFYRQAELHRDSPLRSSSVLPRIHFYATKGMESVPQIGYEATVSDAVKHRDGSIGSEFYTIAWNLEPDRLLNDFTSGVCDKAKIEYEVDGKKVSIPAISIPVRNDTSQQPLITYFWLKVCGDDVKRLCKQRGYPDSVCEFLGRTDDGGATRITVPLVEFQYFAFKFFIEKYDVNSQVFDLNENMDVTFSPLHPLNVYREYKRNHTARPPIVDCEFRFDYDILSVSDFQRQAEARKQMRAFVEKHRAACELTEDSKTSSIVDGASVASTATPAADEQAKPQMRRSALDTEA